MSLNGSNRSVPHIQIRNSKTYSPFRPLSIKHQRKRLHSAREISGVPDGTSHIGIQEPAGLAKSGYRGDMSERRVTADARELAEMGEYVLALPLGLVMLGECGVGGYHDEYVESRRWM